MRYFLDIAYNGKNYHGWQVQNNAVSVQEVINKCLSLQLQEEIFVQGSGRTDSGVHCKQQFAHFDCKEELHQQNFLHKINAFLPNDIVINNVLKVKEDAHARFSALARSYQYHVVLKKNPFNVDFTYKLVHSPNVEQMNQAAEILTKYQDFEYFCKSNSGNEHFLCDVTNAYWQQENDVLVFYIQANRFLRGMVRLITGALLEVGFEKLSLSEFENLLKNKPKRKSKYAVPPEGLFLTKVLYPKEIWK